MKRMPNSDVYVEDPLIAKVVIEGNLDAKRKLLATLRQNYEKAKRSGRVMIDKTHPLLWCAAELVEMFPKWYYFV